MSDQKNYLNANEIGECILKTIHNMFLKVDIMEEFRRLERRRRSLRSDHTCETITDDEIDAHLGITFTESRDQTKDPMKFTITWESWVLCRIECIRDESIHRCIIRYWTVEHGPNNEGYVILKEDNNSDIKYFKHDIMGVGLPSVCRPIVNEIRDALNAELVKQFRPTVESDKKITCYDLETKPGLMTKEVFILDTSYFVIGDIYLLEIDSAYDVSKISSRPVKIPRQVYAICEDVCSTVIHFMIGGIEGRDDLFGIPVHADEIENGLITVKRALTNDSLIQNADKENKQNA